MVDKSDLIINSFLKRQVDGFIIVPAEGAIEQIKNLDQKNIPLVLVDSFFPEINTNYVVIDNYQSTYEATSLLIKRGFKKVAFVGYKSSMIHMKEWKRGYVEVMETNGLLCIYFLFWINRI